MVDELNGEKIDIINYSEDPAEFIAKSLAPAKVISVTVSDGELKECRVCLLYTSVRIAFCWMLKREAEPL